MQRWRVWATHCRTRDLTYVKYTINLRKALLMKDPTQLELVIRALSCGVTGCVEWQPKEADRVRSDPNLRVLTPEGILEDLIEFVTNGGG
jgi:hypothetical protein